MMSVSPDAVATSTEDPSGRAMCTSGPDPPKSNQLLCRIADFSPRSALVLSCERERTSSAPSRASNLTNASSSRCANAASLTLSVTSIEDVSDAPIVTLPLLVVTCAFTGPELSNVSTRSVSLDVRGSDCCTSDGLSVLIVNFIRYLS